MSALPQDAPRGFVSKQEHYAALRRIDKLEADLASAQETLARFHGDPTLVAIRSRFPKHFTHVEAALLAHLYDRYPKFTTYEALNGVRGAHGIKAAHEVENVMGSVRVHLMRVRRALDRLEAPVVTMECARGLGYRLTAMAHRWLTEFVYGGKRK